MGKVQRIIACMCIAMLQFTVFAQLTASAQSTTGVYAVNVTTPGTFGQVMLKTVENWSDVVELTVTGRLNEADMAYFSRMLNMTKLDLGQVDISSVSGCEGLGSLQTVVLPESVKEIEDNAFKDCASLSAINLSQIVDIGMSSFNGCLNLTGNLKFPNLISLGNYAFYDCPGIVSVEMPIVTEIGVCAFASDYSHTSMLAEVSSPNVRTIGQMAFNACSKLTSISIPNCTYLGSDLSDGYNGGCFSGCNSLTSITLCDELEFIPYSTFNSTGLTSIKLPSGLKAIGEKAFEYSKLSGIDIPEGVTTIMSQAFNCPLENITLPSTLESVDDDAFDYKKENYNGSTGKYDYSYVLKDVYCKSVVPVMTQAFNNDMAKGATLHVPAFSVSAYKLDDNWYKFNRIEAIDGDLTDVTINNMFAIIDYSGLANNANITLTSSISQQTIGHLTISANELLSLDNFIINQNFAVDQDGYYDENDYYVSRYSYPYCATLITDNEVRANNITTKVLLPTNSWSFISMPYDVNVSSIAVPDGTMWVVRKYNGANRAGMSGETWENVTSGQILNAGEGYIFHCINGNSDSWNVDYVEFIFPSINNSNKNNIFSDDDIVKTINEYPAEFSHNRGWNLIGNPYPSYFSTQYVDFPAPITVWNGEGYMAYSLADDDYVLHPNEAFFVQCPVNTNQIKFYKDGRTHSYRPSSSLYYSPAEAPLSGNRFIFNFILADDTYSDRARLVLNDEATCDYEIERDANKFMSNNEKVPQIYIIDNGIHYAIDERPLGTGEFSLGIRIGKEGNYKISLNTDNLDYDILLIDTMTGEIIDLSESSYSFESAPQTINNRFVVKVVSKGGMSSIDNPAMHTTGFSINGHQLSIERNMPVSIYSIDGLLVYNGIVEGYVDLPSGIYLLSIDNRTHRIAIK